MTEIEILELVNDYYASDETADLIAALEEKWDQLRGTEEEQNCCFLIADLLVQFSIQEKLFDNAEIWGEILQTCDPEREDDGRREFTLGKAKYHQNDFDEAWELFTIAKEKSGGRCFLEEDREYEEFYLDRSLIS